MRKNVLSLISSPILVVYKLLEWAETVGQSQAKGKNKAGRVYVGVVWSGDQEVGGG